MITNNGDPDVHQIGSAVLANIGQISYMEMHLLFGKNNKTERITIDTSNNVRYWFSAVNKQINRTKNEHMDKQNNSLIACFCPSLPTSVVC